MTWEHDALAADLAAMLRRKEMPIMAFLNVTIPLCEAVSKSRPDYTKIFSPGWEENRKSVRAFIDQHPVGRPDVFAITATHNTKRRKTYAYECKVSRADFLSDVRAEKWRRYTNVAGQVYFAVPRGLISLEEIPAGAGLMVRDENGWMFVKRAPVTKGRDLSLSQAFSLLLAAHSQLAGGNKWRAGAAV